MTINNLPISAPPILSSDKKIKDSKKMELNISQTQLPPLNLDLVAEKIANKLLNL